MWLFEKQGIVPFCSLIFEGYLITLMLFFLQIWVFVGAVAGLVIHVERKMIIIVQKLITNFWTSSYQIKNMAEEGIFYYYLYYFFFKVLKAFLDLQACLIQTFPEVQFLNNEKYLSFIFSVFSRKYVIN